MGVGGFPAGAVVGELRVDRDVEPVEIPVTHHQEGCGGGSRPGGIVAPGRKLRDALVSLEGVAAGKPLPTEGVLLDQRRCVYVPRVFGIAAGQPLVVRNSDKVLHNVFAETRGKAIFNLAMPVQGQELWKKPLKVDGDLVREGTVRFHCQAGHDWMEAWARVFDHPYFTATDAEGAFELSDVPAGTYELRFWHPILGERSQGVTVRAGEAVRVQVTLPVPERGPNEAGSSKSK